MRLLGSLNRRESSSLDRTLMGRRRTIRTLMCWSFYPGDGSATEGPRSKSAGASVRGSQLTSLSASLAKLQNGFAGATHSSVRFWKRDWSCMKHVTREWMAKAEEDFLAATDLALRRKRPVWDAVCFHCQQAAEKY